MTDLADLPAGWRWSTVADVGKVQLGRQRAPQHHTGEHMRPYLRVANVFEDRINTTDVMEMNFTPDDFERYRLHPGDILLNEGQSPELLGRPAMYRGDPVETAFTNSLIRFQAGEDVLPEWALIVFRHHMHSRRFMRECRVTTNIAHLSATRFKSVEFPVPPLADQRRLAEACEARLTELAAAEVALGALTRRLEVYRDDVVRRATLGQLVAQSPWDEPSEKVLIERLGSLDQPLDASSLPVLPEGWSWVHLGDIADVAGGITKDAAKQAADGLIEVPYLRVANVHRGELRLEGVTRIRVTPAKLEALRLQPGDVLMNEGGDRDKLGRGWVWDGQIDDCIHQNHVFRVRVRAGVLHPKLLSWHGNSFGQAWFEKMGKQTTNLASLSMKNVRGLPVPVPPLAEQDRIVVELERQLSSLTASLESARRLALKCSALRRAVLREAFAGSLVQPLPTTRREQTPEGNHCLTAGPGRPGTVVANEPEQRMRKART